MALKYILAFSLILFSSVFGRVYKGECPKIKSTDYPHTFKNMNVIFKIQFEVHKEEYVIFPEGNLTVYTHMNPNIISIEPVPGHCKALLGLVFDEKWR